MALVSFLHSYTYSFTDPSSAQVGLTVEFVFPSPIKNTALSTSILSWAPKKRYFDWQAAYEMSSSQELSFLCTGKQVVSDFGPYHECERRLYTTVMTMRNIRM